jgi:hypothetical protein
MHLFNKALAASLWEEACVFLHGAYVFTQYINTVSTDQELMYSIQFHSSMIFLNLLDGMS